MNPNQKDPHYPASELEGKNAEIPFASKESPSMQMRQSPQYQPGQQKSEFVSLQSQEWDVEQPGMILAEPQKQSFVEMMAQPQPGHSPSRYSKKSLIVCVVIAVLVLIGCGGIAFWYFYPRDRASDDTKAETDDNEFMKTALLHATPTQSKFIRQEQIDAAKAALKTEHAVLRFGGIRKKPGVVNLNKASTFKGKSVEAIIGDFNDAKQMKQMEDAFRERFDYIMFDGYAARHVKFTDAILKSIKIMLKKHGTFIYEMKDGAEDRDIEAITAKLQKAGFGEVQHIPCFNYDRESKIQDLKYHTKPSYNVLKCSITKGMNYVKTQIEAANNLLTTEKPEVKELRFGGTYGYEGLVNMNISPWLRKGPRMIIGDFKNEAIMSAMESGFKNTFNTIKFHENAAKHAIYTNEFLSSVKNMLRDVGSFECPLKNGDEELKEETKKILLKAGFHNFKYHPESKYTVAYWKCEKKKTE